MKIFYYLKSHLNMLLYSVMAFILLIVVNVILYNNQYRLDLTSDNSFTLSKTTIKSLSNLSANITIEGYLKKSERRVAKDMLDQFVYHSDQISYEIIDPDSNPLKAKENEIKSYGTYIVRNDSNKKEERIESLSEESVVDAINRVTADGSDTLYFLTGHGEASLDDLDLQGLFKAKNTLESHGFEIKVLNLIESSLKMPKDAAAIIVAGPSTELLKGEENLLANWLAEGGSMLIALDPGPKFESYSRIINRYGVAIENDIIIDPVSSELGLEPLVATATEYGNSPIVENFNTVSFFSVARSLRLNETKDVEQEMLAQSSASSWGETDLASIQSGRPAFSEAVDYAGPRRLAASASWKVLTSLDDKQIGVDPEEGRLVVVGDSDFFANNSINLSANQQLFTNIVTWLAGSDNRRLTPPAKNRFEPILFTNTNIIVLLCLTLLAIPLFVASVAIVVYRRRRRR